jgi:hypothetical protein
MCFVCLTTLARHWKSDRTDLLNHPARLASTPPKLAADAITAIRACDPSLLI